MNARTDQMTLTPTGIRIGLATVPRQRIEITPDAALIQRALLSKPRSPDFWPGVTLAAAAVFLAVMSWAAWLPGGEL